MKLKKAIKHKIKFPFLALLILIMMASFCYLFGIIINVTPSMKEGVYIRVGGKIQTGDTVAFCLQDPYKNFGLARLYLESGHRCDGADPLIKEIIAVPGDNVILTNNAIQVNGITYPYKTFTLDSQGRNLTIYPRGIYINTTGYWLIGNNAVNSWDSRYWGTITANQILYKVKPLLAW